MPACRGNQIYGAFVLNRRVDLAAGGWAKYEGAHRTRLTKTFAPKFPSLPVEMVSKVVSYAFHTGWY